MANDAEDRPILVGVIALAGVSLVIGLIVALVALGGSRVFGLGGGGGGGGDAAEPTLSLPPVTETTLPADPISLTPEDTASTGAASATPSATETTTTEAADEFTIQSSTTTAGAMERIDISGVYSGGDGAVLSIQRNTDGTWDTIVSNAAVSGDLYSTYIALGRSGENQIRAYDPAADVASNEITITIE